MCVCLFVVEDSELMISAAAALAAPKESDVSGASVEKYYEVVIPSYTPSEFHSHFRMSRQAVQVNSSWMLKCNQ